MDAGKVIEYYLWRREGEKDDRKISHANHSA